MNNPKHLADLLETQRKADKLAEETSKVRRQLDELKRSLVKNIVLPKVPYSFLAGEYLVCIHDRFDSWGDRVVTLDKVKETS